MRRIGFTLLLPLLLARAETSQDRGKKVVMDALAALGGDKYLAMTNRVETGRAYSFYRDELSGLAVAKIYTEYLDKRPPGQLAIRERQVFGKKEESSVLFSENGEAWDLTFRGARPLAPDRVTRYRDTTYHNVFYILRERLKEPGMIFELTGTDVYQNMPVNKVDISDAKNDVVTVFFHQSTKLPVRQVWFRRDPDTRERNEEVTVYSKYRDVGGGVQWPYAIQRERNGEKILEMYSETVAINQDLADTLFTLPSGIKKLKRVD